MKGVQLPGTVLFALFLNAWSDNADNASTVMITGICACVIVYLAFKHLLASFRVQTTRTVIVLLSVWVCLEAVLGLLQNYGVAASNHRLYQLTGSFLNPNPYAGFLVVSCSVLAAYHYQHPDENGCIKALIMASLILSAVVLPATRCRAAFCSGAAVLGLMLWKRPAVRHFMVSNAKLVITVLLVFSGLLYVWKKPSADWRMFQDKISVITIVQNPMRGCGLGRYGGAASRTQACYFKERLELNDGNVVIPALIRAECRKAGWSPYAFCDPLQIGAEAGVPAMLAFLLLVAVSLMVLHRKDSPFFYGALAMQIISLFCYTVQLWQNELLLMIMLAESASYAPVSRRSALMDCGLTVVSVLMLCHCVPAWTAIKKETAAWERDRFFYDTGHYELYCRYCDDRLCHLDCNDDFMLEYGLALHHAGDIEKSDSVLRAGFDYSGNPAFRIALGDNRLLKGDYAAARECYWNAFCCIPDRLLPISRLAVLYKAEGRIDCLSNLIRFARGFKMRIESDVTERIRQEMTQMDQIPVSFFLKN